MTDATEPKRRNDELWLGRRGKDGIDWPTVGPMLRAACEAAKAEFVNIECDSDGRYFGEAAVIDALDAAINAARGME